MDEQVQVSVDDVMAPLLEVIARQAQEIAMLRARLGALTNPVPATAES